ncbi:MAG: DUF4349 domain-containing protein [Armatimonadota bacterium]
MRQNGTESFESPLDEVLESIPQEDPPGDLQQRCMDALEQAAAEQRPSHPRWYAPLRNVVAVAAGLLLIIGTANLYQSYVTGARSADSLSGVRQIEAEAVERESAAAEMAERPASEPQGARMGVDYSGQPGQRPAPGEYHVVRGVSEERQEEAAPEMAMMPKEAAPETSLALPHAEREQVGSTMAGVRAHRVATAYEEEEEEAPPVDAVSADGELGDIVLPHAPRRPVAADQPRTPEVEDPWRDFSGRRQVISTKEMDVEVRDVEDAYDRARAIVDKHGGFVASDRVQISEDEPDVAHLTIRLPVDQFESAITDLRQLGEVVRLVGESLDVTQQYYEEGAEIRGMADREQWLVDRYERETNAHKKRQLKQQIDQLRRELKQEKEILTRLAEQTHWPVLELQLLQSTGPGDFASRMLEGSLSTLAWVGATAIIWVPVVVLLTLFWRRIVPARPED